MEDMCDNAHPPIKFNCISTNPGAVNELLEKCPLCTVLTEFTRKCKYCTKVATTGWGRLPLCEECLDEYMDSCEYE